MVEGLASRLGIGGLISKQVVCPVESIENRKKERENDPRDDINTFRAGRESRQPGGKAACFAILFAYRLIAERSGITYMSVFQII